MKCNTFLSRAQNEENGRADMKIMFLAISYWPSQDGVSQVTQYLAEGLAKKHEVRVVASLSSFNRGEEHENVRIDRVRAKRNRYLSCLQGEKALAKKYIIDYQPDVLIVVSVQSWGYDWFKRELNRLPGRKVLLTHGASCLKEYHVWEQVKKIRFRKQIIADLVRVNNERYWKRYKEKLPADMARFDLVGYLFQGEKLCSYMRQAGLKNGMILENAVEDSFFERRAYDVDGGKEVVFINVSNYEKRKNQAKLISAYAAAGLPNSRLVLIGSEENEYYHELLKMRTEVEATADFKGKIDIWVSIPRSKVLEIYGQADVYVSASSWEAMSISICEAAAGGLMILSTDVGHVSQIPGAQLFETETDLTRLMKQAYENPDIRRQNGMQANAFAEENYRIQKKVDYLEEKIRALF